MKPLRSTAPITSILNPAFRWVRSGDTDVSQVIKREKDRIRVDKVIDDIRRVEWTCPAFRLVRSGDTDVSLAIKIEAKYKEQQRISAAEQQRALYEELLFAVVNKYPGETRHQTALRYIKQAEESRRR